MSEDRNSVLIFGLGGAGLRIVSRIAAQGIAGLDTAVADSDAEAVARVPAGTTVIQAASGQNWHDGCGCGGDIMRGEQIIAPERRKIQDLMENRKLVIVTAGLGGGIGTGGIRTLASIARTINVPAVFVLTTPFSFESFARRKAAEECISELLPMTDILLRIPNDLLFSRLSSDSSVQEAFERSCDEIARSVIGLCGILNCTFAVNTDYAGFMAILRGRLCECGLGTGLASAMENDPDRASAALRKALESPFLGGAAKIASSDAVIVSLCAGPGLQLGEMKRTLEAVAELTKNGADIISGFNTADFMGNALQVTIVAIHYKDSPASPLPVPEDDSLFKTPKAPAKPVRKRKAKDPMTQGTLPLQTYAKGIFTNSQVLEYDGVDLDVPTFQRQNIAVDCGQAVR